MSRIPYSKVIFYTLLLVFGFMLIKGVIWRFDVPNRTLEYDEGLFIYTADKVDRGISEYTEDFDNMPPGIYYLYILSFKVFGNNPIAAHMVSVLSDIAIIFLLIAIGWLLSGPMAGLGAGGLYAFCFVMLRWAPKGSTENPMMMLMLASLLLYLWVVCKKPEAGWYLIAASGFFAGCAFLVKQPAVFFGPTIVGHLLYLWYRGQIDRNKYLRIALLMFGGFAAALIVTGVFLAGKGILSDAIYNGFVFPFTAQYDYGMTALEKLQDFKQKGLILMPAFLLLGITGAIDLARHHTEKRVVPILLIVPVLVFYLWAGDFYQHYLIQLAPGLALAAAIFSWEVLSRGGRRPAKALIIITLLIFALGNQVRMEESYIGYDKPQSRIFPTAEWYPHDDQRLDYQVMVGKRISMNLGPGEKIVTTTPTYAYLAGVPNSYRYFYLAPLTMAASGNDFADLPQAVLKARYFIVEDSRVKYVGAGLYKSVSSEWKLIKSASEPAQHLQVWENPAFFTSPAVSEPVKQ